MKQKRNWLEMLSEKTVMLIVLAISGSFVVEAARHTYRVKTTDAIHQLGVDPVKQLFYAVIMVLGMYVFGRLCLWGTKNATQQKKRVRILVTIDLVITGVLLGLYTAHTHIPGHWDQLQVYYYAQQFIAGDYSGMDYAYLCIYPHQYGLIFLEGLVLRLWNSYHALQYCNVVFVLGIIYGMYSIAENLFDKAEISLYTLFGCTFFLPMHLFVNYIYGDLCAPCMAILVVWAFIRYLRTEKYRYYWAIVFASAVGTLAKKNVMITFIALLILCVIETVVQKNLKLLLIGMLPLMISFASFKCVNLYYEWVSGYKIEEGVPPMAWIIMGISDDQEGSIGIFNGYNEAIWNEVGGDLDKVNKDIEMVLRERQQEFRNNPEYARDFFRYKIFEQWLDPSFSSLNETGKGVTEEIMEENKLVAWVYSDEVSERIYRFMGHLVFLIYLGLFLYTARGIIDKSNMGELILPVAFIGGFLLSIVWEAKGKYIISYVIYMIPYMGAGIYFVQERVVSWIKRVVNRVH
ncbi:MAG: hypothetical protein IJ794_17445 [Lachnospiraceae bacterium]|nr:hypothetical protein [Lachnospiraceae bacterium]